MDALFAELMGMGFELDQIKRCHEALTASSSSPLNLQTATEWLLNHASSSSEPPASEPPASEPPASEPPASTLVLTPPTTHTPETNEEAVVMPDHDVQKPVSSSRDLGGVTITTQPPLTSRHDLNTAHVYDKERFAVKEREEAVRVAREIRRADFHAKEKLRKQIQEDRRAIQERSAKTTTTPTNETTPRELLIASATPTQAILSSKNSSCDESATSATCTSATCTSATCRVQVRLPSGRVLRRVFPSSAILNDVASFVVTSEPKYSTVTFMQPYPRHKYTSEEGQRSLEALRLYPSTSLVVINLPNQEVGVVGNQPDAPPPEVMDVSEGGGDSGEGDSDGGDDSDGDDDDDVISPAVAPVRPRAVIGNAGPMGLRQRGFNPFHGGGGDGFSGQGHRLGGKEGAVLPEEDNSMRTAILTRTTALRRNKETDSSSSGPSPFPSHSLPSLESLCTRVLVLQSTNYGLPSCSSISPLLAHRLLEALKREKKLNTKTITAFYGCPLHTINVDNYLYTTNELISNMSHFPALCHLSMSSCGIVTDRAMIDMFPFMKCLRSLNINGCSQLSQAMFRALRGCKRLEVLRLSQVKVNDDGVRLLLHYKLLHLKELDVSYTQVTSQGLELLPSGAPHLENLSLESTQVHTYFSLVQLDHLQSLNLSHCPPPHREDLAVLSGCHDLVTLTLSGMALSGRYLRQLSGLQLRSLKLPDRNLVFDDAMETISGFPLISLDLSDYLYITDSGISCISSMTTITSLSLARTKLSDVGMPFLAGLCGLKELTLDSTLITDNGMSHLSGLINLHMLSLSNNGLTSDFIMNGTLRLMGMLSKLNLSRTAVCDEGVKVLSLPSLTMLNLDWTCITDAITLPLLRKSGCPVLEILRERNTGQPKPMELT